MTGDGGVGVVDEGDLGELLRDWRLTECEHVQNASRPTCCSPCLRDRILASEWFAARVSQPHGVGRP